MKIKKTKVLIFCIFSFLIFVGDKSVAQEKNISEIEKKNYELLTSALSLRKKIVRNRLEKRCIEVEELHLKILKNFDNEKLHLEKLDLLTRDFDKLLGFFSIGAKNFEYLRDSSYVGPSREISSVRKRKRKKNRMNIPGLAEAIKKKKEKPILNEPIKEIEKENRLCQNENLTSYVRKFCRKVKRFNEKFVNYNNRWEQVLTSLPDSKCKEEDNQEVLFYALDRYNSLFDYFPEKYKDNSDNEEELFKGWVKVLDNRIRLMENFSYLIGSFDYFNRVSFYKEEGYDESQSNRDEGEISNLINQRIHFRPKHPYTLMYLERGLFTVTAFNKSKIGTYLNLTNFLGTSERERKLCDVDDEKDASCNLWFHFTEKNSKRVRLMKKQLDKEEVLVKEDYTFLSLKKFQKQFMKVFEVNIRPSVEDRYKEKDIKRDLPYKAEVYYKILKNKEKRDKEGSNWSQRRFDYLEALYKFQLTKFFLEKTSFNSNGPVKNKDTRSFIYKGTGQGLISKHRKVLIIRNNEIKNVKKESEVRAYYELLKKTPEEMYKVLNDKNLVLDVCGKKLRKIIREQVLIYDEPGILKNDIGCEKIRKVKRFDFHTLTYYEDRTKEGFKWRGYCSRNLWIDNSGKSEGEGGEKISLELKSQIRESVFEGGELTRRKKMEKLKMDGDNEGEISWKMRFGTDNYGYKNFRNMACQYNELESYKLNLEVKEYDGEKKLKVKWVKPEISEAHKWWKYQNKIYGIPLIVSTGKNGGVKKCPGKGGNVKFIIDDERYNRDKKPKFHYNSLVYGGENVSGKEKCEKEIHGSVKY